VGKIFDPFDLFGKRAAKKAAKKVAKALQEEKEQERADRRAVRNQQQSVLAGTRDESAGARTTILG